MMPSLDAERIKAALERTGLDKGRCEKQGCPYEGFQYVWIERYLCYMCPLALTPEERKAAGIPEMGEEEKRDKKRDKYEAVKV